MPFGPPPDSAHPSSGRPIASVAPSPTLKVLDEQTRHHPEEEEEHLFPKVKKICSENELDALGQEMLACQAALADAGEERVAVVEQIDEAAPLQ